MTQYWFKPKAYGFGGTPVTWQGWLLVLFHVAVVVGFTVSLVVGRISGGRAIAGLSVVALVTTFAIWLSMMKTEGSWSWRWGARGKS